jgi:FdhD protein
VSQKLPLTAAVLAGGRSMRMGVDKTLLPVDGQALVARVVAAVEEVCTHLMVITNRPEMLAGVGLDAAVMVHSDEVPYQGPLGGLVTALAEAPDEWVLAVAADMPHVSSEVVRALWEARDRADIVVPITERGPEPLLALYSRRCLPIARKVLASGRRRLVALFPDLRVVEYPIEALRRLDPELKSFLNINTPDELALAQSGTAPTTAQKAPRGRSGGLPVERPITLYLNQIEVVTVQATPEYLEEMSAGFFVAEGLLTDREALKSIDVDRKRGLVYVTTSEMFSEDRISRTRTLTSGCGKGMTFSTVGHAHGLTPIESSLVVEQSMLIAYMRAMARAAGAYLETGGMHACGLVRQDRLLLVREDVGRHNALDKLLGRAWLDRISTRDAVVLSTGRISYEMAVKAAKAVVPVVVSRTAVTDLAAEIARLLGITLAGYARGGAIIPYTHPERILLNRNVENHS